MSRIAEHLYAQPIAGGSLVLDQSARGKLTETPGGRAGVKPGHGADFAQRLGSQRHCRCDPKPTRVGEQPRQFSSFALVTGWSFYHVHSFLTTIIM
jgi:hypothetical protein